MEGHTDLVNTLAFSPSGTILVSGGNDSDIRIWNPASGNCDAIIKDHSSPINSLCWISDTVVASGSEDGLVKLWNIPARKWLEDFSSHTRRVNSVSCSADGSRLASVSGDGTVKVYDVPNRATLKTIPMSSAFVSLSPKGDRLVCGSEDLEIWDLSRDVRLTIPAANGRYSLDSACFSPDATLIASAGSKTVKLWTTELHEIPDSHSSGVNCMCFSEDGSLIASGADDGTVKIWDTANCSCLVTLRDSTDELRTYITSVAFSLNRTFVAAGDGDGVVRIWNLESQKSRTMKNFQALRVNHIRFSPDGSKLVSGLCLRSALSCNSIRVWDAETGSVLAFLEDMDRSIEWISFSDGGEIVVQASGELEKLKLCAVSTFPPTVGSSEQMAGISTPFKLVLSTNDEPTIRPPPPSYRLLRERSMKWDDHWILDFQGRRVFYWLDAFVSACHMRKIAVGTSDGRVAILDFSNVSY
jgi:WD40 repeat protein